MLLKEIETDPGYTEFKDALYKEYILHLTTGTPTWMLDSILAQCDFYYDFMMTRDPNLTPEELITDMGDYLDTPVILKTMEQLNNTTVIKL